MFLNRRRFQIILVMVLLFSIVKSDEIDGNYNNIIKNNSGTITINSGDNVKSKQETLREKIPLFDTKVTNKEEMESLYDFLSKNKNKIVEIQLSFCESEKSSLWLGVDSKEKRIKIFDSEECVRKNKPKNYNNHSSEHISMLHSCNGTVYYLDIFWDKNTECTKNKWGATIVNDFYYVPKQFGFGQGHIEVMLKKLDASHVLLKYQ